jgi:Ca2+-binding RTX toxin-like protein
MGTKYLGPNNDTFAAHKEGPWYWFDSWKSWTIYGNGGNDVLTGGPKDDWIDGGDGHDYLYGKEGNDQLYGQAGYDYLSGGAGNDYLDGGIGAYTYDIDTISGDAGADTFVLGVLSQVNYQGAGYAVIADFNYLEKDKIKVGGSIGDYTIEAVNFGVGTSALDTLIKRYGDVIAVVQDRSGNQIIPSLDFVT